MQIILWRLWNGVLFGAIVLMIPTAGHPVGAETPAAETAN